MSALSTYAAGGVALPGAAAAGQQVTVSTGAGGFNRVQITICWKAPQDLATRSYTLVTYIN